MESLDILVVDDEEDIRSIFTSFLMLNHGHKVFAFDSAEKALAQLPYQTFHLAYLDQHLDGMEGLILGEYLKKNNPDTAP